MKYLTKVSFGVITLLLAFSIQAGGTYTAINNTSKPMQFFADIELINWDCIGSNNTIQPHQRLQHVMGGQCSSDYLIAYFFDITAEQYACSSSWQWIGGWQNHVFTITENPDGTFTCNQQCTGNCSLKQPPKE